MPRCARRPFAFSTTSAPMSPPPMRRGKSSASGPEFKATETGPRVTGRRMWRESSMRKLQLLGAAAAIGLALGLTPAGAAGYPDHPVKVIVPFAAGGPTDVMARLIAQKMSEDLKQQFYVENRPGAGGNIGMAEAARANPDGYTLLVASSSFVVNPSLYAKAPYDPYKDFAPITLAAASPNILVVNANFPAKTVKELIDVLKKEPNKYSIAN